MTTIVEQCLEAKMAISTIERREYILWMVTNVKICQLSIIYIMDMDGKYYQNLSNYLILLRYIVNRLLLNE